ncbi:hypothetical protein Tco_0452424 [Tanacetum coccineum]
MEESLSKFMAQSTKGHDENFILIKEIRASMDAAIGNQGASIKALEIQIGKMSNVLQENGSGSLLGSTEINLRDHVKSISTTVEAEMSLIRHTEVPQNQGSDLGHTDDQPNVKAASKHDWFKKPERPPTLDHDWNARYMLTFFFFQTTQTWTAVIAPSRSLLSLSTRSRVELEYHFEEYRGCQVVPIDTSLTTPRSILKGHRRTRSIVLESLKVAYDRFVILEESHTGSKRQRF